MNLRDPYIKPVTDESLRSAGIDPADLYWSGTFHCWRLAGEWAASRPYRSTESLLVELGLACEA